MVLKQLLVKLMRVSLVALAVIMSGIAAVAQNSAPEEGVWDVAWDSTGTLYAAANPEGRVYIYASDGRLIRTLAGHEGRSSAVAWSPDDTILASGGWDPYLRFWEVETGELLNEIYVFDEGIFVLDWQAEGSYLVVVGFDRIKILDTVTMNFLDGDIPGNYLDVQWSPLEANIFAFADIGFAGLIWIKSGGFEGVNFENDIRKHLSVDWNFDGTRLVVSEGMSNNIAIWDVESETIEQTFLIGSEIADAVFIGEFVAVATQDGTINMINLVTEEIQVVAIGLGRIYAIDVNPQTNEIIYVGMIDNREPLIGRVDIAAMFED